MDAGISDNVEREEMVGTDTATPRHADAQLSMSQQKTPMSGMSSSLKERLKKCGRYHPATSPYGRPSTPQSSRKKDSSSGVPSNPLCSLQLANTAETATAKNAPITPLSSRLMILSKDVTTAGNISTPNPANKRRQSQPRNILHEKSNVFEQPSVCDLQGLDTNSESRCVILPEKCNSDVTKQNQFVKINIGESRTDVDTHRLSSPTAVPTSQPAAGVATSGSNCSNSQDGQRNSCQELLETKKELETQLVQRKEVLRKLTMVKTYRTKNDLHQLQTLIDKWRSTCQQAVLDLHQQTSEPRPSLTQLMHHMGLDTDLLNYNEEEECFDVG